MGLANRNVMFDILEPPKIQHMLGLSSIFLFSFKTNVFCNSTKTITNSSLVDNMEFLGRSSKEKNGLFTVRLTVRVYGQGVVIFSK